MTGVIIAANERDKKMWDRFPGIICQNFSAIWAGRQGLRMSGETPEFIICHMDDVSRLPINRAVIIFKDIQQKAPDIPQFSQVVAVVDAANQELMEQVSATKLPAITCGLSPRDTLTLTSIGVDDAVISLQRAVNCFDGTVAEPQEIPLKLSAPIDSFTLMATASVFILSGRIDDLKIAEF